MMEAARGDITPGTSVMVVMSSDGAIDTVAQASQGQDMELIRSDLSVQQQDDVRVSAVTLLSRGVAHVIDQGLA